MGKKISGVYKIENTVTGDFYIGSSRDIKQRWANHKYHSSWKKCSNILYRDMQKYGVENFKFTILCEVEPEQLTVMEQKMIEELHPTYNKNMAKGRNIHRYKQQMKKAQIKYNQSDRGKETHRKYYQSDRGKESHKNYLTQPCSYNGETLTLCALAARFQRAGIEHPTVEAKKYLIIK